MEIGLQGEAAFSKLRNDLVSFLRWKRAVGAEDLAQESVLRVLQKLYAGESIRNLQAYARRVAELVHIEDVRLRRRETALPLGAPGEADDCQERLSRCLEYCKGKCLSRREVKFIERYYASDILERKLLAKSRNVSEGQLRKQAMEIRKKLRDCVQTCMHESEL